MFGDVFQGVNAIGALVMTFLLIAAIIGAIRGDF